MTDKAAVRKICFLFFRILIVLSFLLDKFNGERTQIEIKNNNQNKLFGPNSSPALNTAVLHFNKTLEL